jgi:peptidoglycan/LPS O-acetylase OafA/YrhL/acyl carrier protein
MTCNVQIDTLGSWSSFVGSKIGSMHALFVLSHILALPSYLVFHFGLTGYTNFPSKLRIVTTQLLTGMLGYYDGNLGSTWFQSVVYKFIILFPWLDRLLRGLSDKSLLKWGAAMVLASIVIPSSLFALDHPYLHFTLVTWFPNLISAMIAGHLFKRFGPAQTKDSIDSASIFQKPQFWGVVTDTMSVFFLLILVAVAFSPNCLNVEVDMYKEMRPNDLEYNIETFDDEELVWACNVTWDEYVHYVHGDEECWATFGRWEVEITHAFWDYRLGSPLVMIWLYGLAFGQGITANIMKSRLLQFLAPLSYPVYLLHIPIARYYWLATRGSEAKQWWSMTGDYPVPVDFHEMLLIFGISILLGYLIDRYILPHVIPYTVNIGVFVCQNLSDWFGIPSKMSSAGTGTSVYDQVQHVVKALSGVDVSQSSSLDSLGLDSLGATAFLGTLRASLPTAKRLSLQKLVAFETVGDLVDFLSENECTTPGVGNQEGNIWNDTIPALDYSFSDSLDDSFSDSLHDSLFSEEFRLSEGNNHQ